MVYANRIPAIVAVQSHVGIGFIAVLVRFHGLEQRPADFVDRGRAGEYRMIVVRRFDQCAEQRGL